MQTLKGEFLAVYGTLRRRSLFQRGLQVAPKLRFFCLGRLRGKLFSQKGYPAAVQGYGIIPVEIFQILDATVWNDLDRYEGCDFTQESSSLFYRKKVRLLRPSLVVWAYFLGNRSVRGNLVGDANRGCYLCHLTRKPVVNDNDND
jgi:gamma-glutamylcyclotransferase (GGCT)/AIG2-like uncharacterized protein YtfP